MTVSRVINKSGYASPQVRERVLEVVAELGYVPNALARSLHVKRTHTLALVLTDIGNPFFTTVARGVEDAASARGFSVMFCNTDEDQEEESAHVRLLLQKQVDGLLLVPASSASPSIGLAQLRGIPVVVLDRRVTGSSVDVVRCDSEGGAHAVVRHLIELGHREIAVLSAGPMFLSRSTASPAPAERWPGPGYVSTKPTSFMDGPRAAAARRWRNGRSP